MVYKEPSVNLEFKELRGQKETRDPLGPWVQRVTKGRLVLLDPLENLELLEVPVRP